MPAGIRVIGGGAFAFQKTLTGIFLQEGVESIGEYAFYEMDSLEEIYIPSSVTEIKRAVLGEYSPVMLYVYMGSEAQKYARNHGYSYTGLTCPQWLAD